MNKQKESERETKKKKKRKKGQIKRRKCEGFYREKGKKIMKRIFLNQKDGRRKLKEIKKFKKSKNTIKI